MNRSFRVRGHLLAATALFPLSISVLAIPALAAPTADAPAALVEAAAADRPVVLAQADAARPANSYTQVALLQTETVTVNARRVDEDLQKVPVAISVVSANWVSGNRLASSPRRFR